MHKVALITGGSSGLGYYLAKELGLQQYKVIILARDKEKINTVVSEFKTLGIDAMGISCDISNEKQIQAAHETIRQTYHKIDFLILNAGIVVPKLLADYSNPEEIKEQLDVNLYGTILCSWTFVPMLQKGSKLLFTSSGFGLTGAAGYSLYCATKAGIINFAESLRRELLNKEIDVYVSCPGDIDTPMLREEIYASPEWMTTTVRKALPAEKVGKKILAGCKGRNKLLIIPSTDVLLLSNMKRLLPTRTLNIMLDSLLPLPN